MTAGGSPSFSILMPVFNGGSYLSRAVGSVLAQSFGDWELLIVDDGSTDGAVEELPAADSRIRIHKQANAGAPAASNQALSMARGRFVAILDQDDLWMPAKLERHLQCFEQDNRADFNFTWSHYIGASDERLPLPPRHWRGRVSFDLLARDFVIGNTSSVAFRSEALSRAGTFDRALPCMYDLDIVLRVAALGESNGVAIEEDLCAYRRHAGQMSGNWRVLRNDWERLLNGSLSAAMDETGRREANANMTRYFAFLAYECRDLSSSARLLSEALRLLPAKRWLDSRNLKLAAGVAGAALLPDRMWRGVESLIARYRG